jgi:AcrR family transcriptional regulator
MGTRAEERAALRREEILEAAERAFARNGFHATGIADIAADLGIGHGTFYRYFKNKHDIAVSVSERVFARLAEVAMSEDPTTANSVDEYRAQTERILNGMLALSRSHPVVLRLFHEQLVSIDVERLSTILETYALFTAQFLQNGVEKGFLRADLDIEPTSEALVALIFEGTRRALRSDDDQAQRWATAGVRLMFEGVTER